MGIALIKISFKRIYVGSKNKNSILQ